MGVTLSHDQARRAYDRIGSLQDTQAFYEDPATRILTEQGGFDLAQAVFEFGCGTGRFAARLLEEYLPSSASYRGVDISPRMVSIARARLQRFGSRARVSVLASGSLSDQAEGGCDRFVSNYVLGLLSDDDISDVLRNAHRMLRHEGLVCLADLTEGVGPLSRTVARAWAWIQARAPSLVGGCRPIDTSSYLSPEDWTVEHKAVVVAYGIPSEAVIARRREADGHPKGD
jgi:SAM-dependent methyltransferase